MKKLIAIMFCLAVLATVARAQAPEKTTKTLKAPARVYGEYNKRDTMQKAVEQQVNAAQRTVVLQASAPGFESATGEAILAGFTDNYKTMVLIATLSFSNDLVENLEDAEHISGIVKQGSFNNVSGKMDYRHVSLQGKAKQEHSNLAKITMSVNLSRQDVEKAKQFTNLTDEQAVKMAQMLQDKENKALKEYRSGIIDSSRKK